MKTIVSLIIGTLAATVLCLSIGYAANGVSLQDFKNADAVSEPSCEQIPYEEVRKRCMGLRDDLRDYCKEDPGVPLGCEELDTYSLQQKSDAMQNNLKGMDGKVNALREQRDAATDDTAKTEIQNEIDKIVKRMDEMRNEIEKTTHTIDDYKYRARGLVERAKRCIEARNDQMVHFKDARRMASSESEPDIKAVAGSLISKWDKSIAGHTKQVGDIENLIRKCEKATRGDQF